MSIVIVGGNDRMVCQYKEMCRQFSCHAKVFTQMSSALRSKVGAPDLFIIFTGTVSHKMVHFALTEAKKSNSRIARSHTCSLSALRELLDKHCLNQ